MPAKPEKMKLLNDSILKSSGEELRAYLRDTAQKLVSEISASDPDRGEELISSFIFELAGAAAEQRQKQERRVKQSEGITAAKASGVQFGRPRIPLPEAFDACRRAWRDGELSLQKAAESCGMKKATFQRAVIRAEENMGLSAQ